MDVFASPDFADHEQVVFVRDASADLRAIIAIHDTRLGPGMGGCRVWQYPNEEAALNDVLRLSKGMTYKAAVASVLFGGGKSVILLKPGQEKTPQLIRALGRAIERLAGRYVTGEDIGTTPEDMAELRAVTTHVLGTPAALGGSGDPSPSTALGCFVGIEASVRHRLGAPSVQGLRVAVQGLGKVGSNLCTLLHRAGAQLIVADTDASRVAAAKQSLGAHVVASDDIYGIDADVLAPCAFGAVINDATLKQLRVRIVAGGANNQLAHSTHGEALRAQSILYAPDYVINGGGLIQLAIERTGYDSLDVDRRVRGIAGTLTEIYKIADADRVGTHVAADRLAERRIREGAELALRRGEPQKTAPKSAS